MRRATLRAVGVLGAATLSLPFAAALTQPASAAHSAGHPSLSTTKHTIERLCSRPTRPGIMACFALRRVDSLHQHVGSLALPSGYGPADLQSAYKISTTGGAGATVAIVDAYDDPKAESDLASYRSTYGLPPCTTANGCFKKVNQSGQQGSYPPADTGWAGEISLDVDMVSAVCPNCKILLVEATSPTTANLGTAVNTAVSLGAKYVSNSYGGGESSSETSYDTSYYRHAGVAITASTGDNGYGVSYPASSPYVTAVGGTSLSRASSTRGWTESAWSGAGSGCSGYETKPSYQTNVATGCSRRAVADVSAVADPNTGVAVYQTYGGSGWAVYGGTSASAPIIAGVYALAGTPGASDNPASYPYAHPGNLFDVTTGSNGSCSTTVWCHAGTGWDGPTGLGTPNGTAAFTAGGGGGGCTGQRLGNPGFETGSAAPWTATSGVISANGSGQTSHSGSYFAWLDGYGSSHTDKVSQSVTIPAGCTASLSFYLKITTSESGSTAYDVLTVRAGTTAVATYSNANATGSYVLRTVNLSQFAGQTVSISFTGVEDGSLQTSFVLDDTALTLG